MEKRHPGNSRLKRTHILFLKLYVKSNLCQTCGRNSSAHPLCSSCLSFKLNSIISLIKVHTSLVLFCWSLAPSSSCRSPWPSSALPSGHTLFSSFPACLLTGRPSSSGEGLLFGKQRTVLADRVVYSQEQEVAVEQEEHTLVSEKTGCDQIFPVGGGRWHCTCPLHLHTGALLFYCLSWGSLLTGRKLEEFFFFQCDMVRVHSDGY